MKSYVLFPVVFIVSCWFSFGRSGPSPKITRELESADSCTFSTVGHNDYFILEPGYQLVLEGKEKGKTFQLVISVLNETRMIGGVETRIVEEKESVGGKLVEISKNFFAYCQETGSIFYFGEEVDMYKNEKVVSHEGAWIAEGKNKPGVVMPGKLMVGASYLQENAPGVAMDRATIISLRENVETPSGTFTNCLKTEESSALHPGEKEFKFYAAGIGLVKEEDLILVKYGFVK